MTPENETSTTTPGMPIELPGKVAALPTGEPEIPGITPAEIISTTTEINPDDYNESVNNLLAKYTKTKR